MPAHATHGNADSRALADQHHQALAARQSGVEQVALKHGIVLSDDRYDDRRILGTLRLVNRVGVGQHDLVELSEWINHRTSIDFDGELTLRVVDVCDEADVAVESVPVVVVLDLHDLVADTVGEAEALDGWLIGGAGIESGLQRQVQGACASPAPMHRAEHLHISDRIETEAGWDALGHDLYDLAGRILGIARFDEIKIAVSSGVLELRQGSAIDAVSVDD